MVEATRPDARRTRAGRGADRADVRARRLAATGAGRREPDGAADGGAFEDSIMNLDPRSREVRGRWSAGLRARHETCAVSRRAGPEAGAPTRRRNWRRRGFLASQVLFSILW